MCDPERVCEGLGEIIGCALALADGAAGREPAEGQVVSCEEKRRNFTMREVRAAVNTVHKATGGCCV